MKSFYVINFLFVVSRDFQVIERRNPFRLLSLPTYLYNIPILHHKAVWCTLIVQYTHLSLYIVYRINRIYEVNESGLILSYEALVIRLNNQYMRHQTYDNIMSTSTYRKERNICCYGHHKNKTISVQSCMTLFFQKYYTIWNGVTIVLEVKSTRLSFSSSDQ